MICEDHRCCCCYYYYYDWCKAEQCSDVALIYKRKNVHYISILIKARCPGSPQAARGPLSFPLLLADREYCVALVHKQAPRRPDAPVHMVTMNGRFYIHSALTRATCTAKVSHVRFSVGCCDREFLNRENFCSS